MRGARSAGRRHANGEFESNSLAQTRGASSALGAVMMRSVLGVGLVWVILWISIGLVGVLQAWMRRAMSMVWGGRTLELF